MTEIQDKIVTIISEKLGVDPSEVTMEANFTQDLGADSLDTVELLQTFDKEFNIEIPDDQYENLVTVGSIVKFVEEKMAQNN